MRVYLIRHAQSENNALHPHKPHLRKVDPALTALGFQQRDLLADHLAGSRAAYGITKLYTSAMYRSLLTAHPLAEALDTQPMLWPDLHEKGGLFQQQNGSFRGFRGMTRSEITSEFPDYARTHLVAEDGWYDASLGFEPEPHSFYRAIKVAGELQAGRDSDDVIALVSHAGFLDILLKAIFGQLPSQAWSMRFYHENTAITRVNYDGDRPVLHFLNRVDHLPAELRSY